jgi:transposase
MTDYRLSNYELAELRAAHRRARGAQDVRQAYRINAVILLGQGRTVADVADALLFDPDTVRDYSKRYKQGGLDELLRMSYVGSEALLNATQLKALDAHLQDRLYDTAQAVARYVEARWGVHYSASGMTAVLHRLGYVHKKAKLEPGKHPAVQVQEEFVERYENLKENKDDGDIICFMDATHPLHNPVIGRGWIKRGEEHPIQSNTGRRRLNINGAINIETMGAHIRFDDTIDAESTIALFKQLQGAYPAAKRIIVICDNAGYYKSRLVGEYLKTSPIELLPLPAYSPNLNLIERFWKFFKRKTLYNQYYETFGLFRAACKAFFENLDQYMPDLKKLLTENFQIIADA